MNWGYFFAWVAVILGLFFVTGWPVSPELQGSWGNQYAAKSLTYYAFLYLHYLLGALFFTFLGLGLFRTVVWKGSSSNNNNNNKQLIFLLAWSVLTASAVVVALTYRYAPDDNNNDNTNDDSNVVSNNNNNNTVAMTMDSTQDGNKTDL